MTSTKIRQSKNINNEKIEKLIEHWGASQGHTVWYSVHKGNTIGQ